MGQLKSWRDAIVTRLKAQVTNAAAVKPSADPKLSLSLEGWDSPTVLVELTNLSGGPPRLLGSTEQETEMEANIYVAVRTGTLNETSQEVEYNEEAVDVGVFDIVDAVFEALKNFDVQASPIARLFIKSAAEWAKADGSTIWRIAYTLKGNYTAF